MTSNQSQKKFIDLNWNRETKGLFSNSNGKSVTLQAKHIIADGSGTSPEPHIKRHIEKELVNSILNTLINYKERENALTPNVILDFSGQNFSSGGQGNNNLKLQAQSNSTDRSSFNAEFFIKEPQFSLDRLVLNPETETELTQIITLIEKRLILRSWGFGSLSKSFLFYGPAGTGKSSAVHGIAKYLNKKLIEISYGSLEDKFVGKTSEHIRDIFALARSTNAVLFIDEAEDILGKRFAKVLDSASQGLNTARNTILREIEDLNQDPDFTGILFFATNNYQALDPGAFSRLLNKAEFTLPDLENRQKIMKYNLPETFPMSDNIDFYKLAEELE
ncbi:MAG: AAA family ATPase [Moorea sp. SIO2I5]|nr:AAA family ATPase [Moorena sp. SIO2I5]